MITPLPTPPSRANPEGFSVSADAFLGALPAFGDEANVLQADVNAKQLQAAASQVAAAASQAAAEAASNATAWVSGTTYAVGNVRYSPINFKSYRRKTAGAGTTDPSADSTNWQLLTGLGDVDLSSTQTLTNKTISGSSNTITNVSLTAGVTGTLPIANGGTGATSAATARTNLDVPSRSGVNASGTWDISISGASASTNYIDTTVALSATAGAAAGSIGTYAMLQPVPDATYTEGSAVAGSNLRWVGTYTDGAGNSGYTPGLAPSGTWRAMGRTLGGFGRTLTIWLRIS